MKQAFTLDHLFYLLSVKSINRQNFLSMHLQYWTNSNENATESVDNYSNLYVFSVDNMRNNHFKAVREAWKKDNRRATFFMCKNRVMALALGREEEEEYNDNLHKVSRLLRGPNRGLMLTNEGMYDILKAFSSLKFKVQNTSLYF